MAAIGWFRYAYLAHVARPKSVRQLYRMVKRQRVCRIVEIGIADVARSITLVEVAQRYAGEQAISYTGIDWFEARTSPLAPLSLKEAYRLLRPTGANVRLVPGEPGRSLAAAANAHQNTDLILISSAILDSQLATAWFYVPRMLHERTVLLREGRDEQGLPTYQMLAHAQVSVWAGQTARRRVA